MYFFIKSKRVYRKVKIDKILNFVAYKTKDRWPERISHLQWIPGQIALLLFGYKYKLSRRQILSCWARGFYGDRSILYDFDKYSYDPYISDYVRERKAGRINRKYVSILNDKVIFSFVVTSLGAPTPQIYGEQRNDKFVQYTDSSLSDLFKANVKLIAKPRMGSGGFGFRVISSENYFLNDGDIVCEYIEQARYASKIFAQSTNTIRILTAFDYDFGEPFIAIAIHRFGTKRSKPVDNWGNGGLSAMIDGQTGVIGAAVAKPTSSNLEWFDQHPETGMVISGVTIPGWSNICSSILKLAKRLPVVPYVGWDIAVTENGFGFSIIEGNGNPDVNLLQIHQPLLVDARLAKFYRYHGII